MTFLKIIREVVTWETQEQKEGWGLDSSDTRQEKQSSYFGRGKIAKSDY